MAWRDKTIISMFTVVRIAVDELTIYFINAVTTIDRQECPNILEGDECADLLFELSLKSEAFL